MAPSEYAQRNPHGFTGYGNDCAPYKYGDSGNTFFAWRWFDINGDRKPDLIGSPIRGGLYSYDLQQGSSYGTTTHDAPVEPQIFGEFPSCPQDRKPWQRSRWRRSRRLRFRRPFGP